MPTGSPHRLDSNPQPYKEGSQWISESEWRLCPLQRTFPSEYLGLICGLNLDLVLALLGVLDNSFLFLGLYKMFTPFAKANWGRRGSTNPNAAIRIYSNFS